MDTVLYEKAQRLVSDEVRGCVSSLIDTLAKEYDGATNGPLADLMEQAFELTSPVLDYEGAAIAAGWKQSRVEYRYGKPISNGPRWWYRGRKPVFGDIDISIPRADSAQEACEMDGIKPYEREVCEHWIVSRWLGERLADMGEKVDFDFAGLVIWARTTTGQAIAMDWVIQQIAGYLYND